MENELSHIRLAIVLVNYNTTDETLQCISSIRAADASGFDIDIYVVDNSTCAPFFPEMEDIMVFRPRENIGLAPAWALVVEKVQEDYDYFNFMNNDVLVSRDYFVELRRGVECWGRESAFGPRIYRYGCSGEIWSRGGDIDLWKVKVTHYSYDKNAASSLPRRDFVTGHLSGCCLIVPTESLKKSGGIDARFFFRGEEWDLCYRLAKHGVKMVLLDNMEIWHKVNASHSQYAPGMLYLAYRAKVLFAKKHHPKWWFPVWYCLALGYTVFVSSLKLSSSGGNSWKKVLKALVYAMRDGLMSDEIKPLPYVR